MARFLIFGDSITYGHCDREGGWVARLRRYIDESGLSKDEGFSIYNLGVSGDNTEDLLKRFDSETRAREKEDLAFIFAIGINDAQYLNTEQRLRVSPEKFGQNIKELIDRVDAYSQKVIFVGLTPVDEDRTTPIPWDTIKFYFNKNIEKYNRLIKNICAEKRVDFVDVWPEFNKVDHTKLLDDGLHPNEKGHKLIFELVKNNLEETGVLPK